MRALIVLAEIDTANAMRITFCQDRHGYFASARKLDNRQSIKDKRFDSLFQANEFYNSLTPALVTA